MNENVDNKDLSAAEVDLFVALVKIVETWVSISTSVRQGEILPAEAVRLFDSYMIHPALLAVTALANPQIAEAIDKDKQEQEARMAVDEAMQELFR